MMWLRETDKTLKAALAVRTVTWPSDGEIAVQSGHPSRFPFAGWDNALTEGFFVSLKGELIDIRPCPSRATDRGAIVEYIGTRLHSTLGYCSRRRIDATLSRKRRPAASSPTSHQPVRRSGDNHTMPELRG